MGFENIAFTTYEGHKDKLQAFVESYGQPYINIPPDPPLTGRMPKRERICRYCDKRTPEVKFKTEPHIIPQLLGSNYGVSDYECDTCNQHFSKLETHFADYLGLVRTITSVGRKKVPKFTSPREALIASQTSKGANKDFITISDENGENFHFNQEQKTWEIKYAKNSYVPIKVYQALLKIGLGVLPDIEVSNYQAIKDFILKDRNQEYFRPFARIFQCTTDFYVERPYCIIFKKHNDKITRPTHMVYLCFENISYQIFLPFNQTELSLYKPGGDVNLLFTPPLLFKKDMENGQFKAEFIDLSSPEKVVGELGYVRFSVDEKLFTHSYNPKTREFKEEPFQSEVIKKIYLSRHEGPINLDDLESGDPK